MPLDHNGNPLNEGDHVWFVCRILAVKGGEAGPMLELLPCYPPGSSGRHVARLHDVPARLVHRIAEAMRDVAP
jgi:hypothetical protein